jgi:hypothetical protein
MIVYDLDHTLIDSSHRAITRADGSLDLDAWRAMSTRGVLGPADYEFLRVHGLAPRVILSRPYGDVSSDGPLKVRLLREASIRPRVFWDDNESVRRAIKRAFPYCSVICPHEYNARLVA